MKNLQVDTELFSEQRVSVSRIGFSAADAHSSLQRTVARLMALGSSGGTVAEVNLALRRTLHTLDDLSGSCHCHANQIRQAAEMLQEAEAEMCRRAEALPDMDVLRTVHADVNGIDAASPLAERGAADRPDGDEFPTFFSPLSFIGPRLHPSKPFFRSANPVPSTIGPDIYWADISLSTALVEAEAAFASASQTTVPK